MRVFLIAAALLSATDAFPATSADQEADPSTEYERDFLARQEARISNPLFRAASRAHGAGNPACVKLGMAVDGELIRRSGGTLAGARNYLERLIRWISVEVYEPTFNVRLEVGTVYDGSSASWMANPSGTSHALTMLENHFNGDAVEERNQHNLMVGAYGEQLGGGVAYLGGLYSARYGHSISAGLNDDNECDMAATDCNRWSKIVMAHELGHNFGAPHTHDIGVDTCASGPCTHPGTIMSYCHLCGGIDNIAYTTFAPEVISRVNGELDSSDIAGTQCQLGPTPPPTRRPTMAPTQMVAGASLSADGLLMWNSGFVCDDDWDANDAQVACREMGLEYRSHSTQQGVPNANFSADDFQCSGSEARLADCSARFGSHNCGQGEGVRVVCARPGETTRAPTPAPTFDASAMRASLSPEGYLMVGAGFVCDDRFDESDARVACRELGGGYVSHQTQVNIGTSIFTADDLGCSGSEGALAECEGRFVARGESHNCGASEGVRLVCSGTSTPAPTTPAPTPTPGPTSAGGESSGITLLGNGATCGTPPPVTRAECERFAEEGHYFDADAGEQTEGCFRFAGELTAIYNNQDAPSGCVVLSYFRRRLLGGGFTHVFGGQNNHASDCGSRRLVYWSKQGGQGHELFKPVCGAHSPATPAPTTVVTTVTPSVAPTVDAATPAPTTVDPATPAPTTVVTTVTPSVAPTSTVDCVRGMPGCGGEWEPEVVNGCDCAGEHLLLGNAMFHNPAPFCAEHQAEAGSAGAYCYVVNATECERTDLVESEFMEGAFWRACEQTATPAPTSGPAPTVSPTQSANGPPARCGPNFMDNGYNGECSTEHFDPFTGLLEAPCCSMYGWCGSSPGHCSCNGVPEMNLPGCVDYSQCVPEAEATAHHLQCDEGRTALREIRDSEGAAPSSIRECNALVNAEGGRCAGALLEFHEGGLGCLCVSPGATCQMAEGNAPGCFGSTVYRRCDFDEDGGSDGEVTDEGCDARAEATLIATFNETGCPNTEIDGDALARWRDMVEYWGGSATMMLHDMYNICLYNDLNQFGAQSSLMSILQGERVASGATQSQRDLCCGEGNRCEVTCRRLSSTWCPVTEAGDSDSDSQDDSGADPTPAPTQPVSPTPPPTPRPTYSGDAGQDGDRYWNLGFYLHADNNLEGAGVKDMREFGDHLDSVAQLGGADALRPTILMDRSRGYSSESLHHRIEGPNGQQLDASFTGSYQMTWEAQDHHWVAAQQDDAEINLDDPAVLAQFVDASYSNDARYNMLDMWNHGAGWMGYGGDSDSSSRGMSLQALARGLRDGLNGRTLDILGFDACLMADFTVLMALGEANVSNYVVASEHLEPGDGWDYDAWRSVTQDALSDPATFGAGIVDGFIDHYGHELLTLAVFDMRQRQALASSFQALFAKLIEALEARDATVRTAISRARGESQDIDLGMYGWNGYVWVDAGSFLEKLQSQLGDCAQLSGLVAAAAQAYEQFVVAERSTPEEGYTGMSLFWPGNESVMAEFRGMDGLFGGAEGAANDAWVAFMGAMQGSWDASQASDGFCGGESRAAFVQQGHFDLDLSVQRCAESSTAVATLVAPATASRVTPEVALRSVTWNEHRESSLKTVEHIEMQVVATLVDGSVEPIIPETLRGQHLSPMQFNTQFSTKWDGRVPVFSGPSTRDLDAFALVYSRISYGHGEASCGAAIDYTEASVPVMYYGPEAAEPVAATVRLFASVDREDCTTAGCREHLDVKLFLHDKSEVTRFDCTFGAHGSEMHGAAPCGHIDAFYHRIPSEEELFAGGRHSVQPESTLFAWSPELSVTLERLEDVHERLRADFRHGNDHVDAVIRYNVRDEFGQHNHALATYSATEATFEAATPLSFRFGESEE